MSRSNAVMGRVRPGLAKSWTRRTGIGDRIMVLGEIHEGGGADIQRRRAPPLSLMGIDLILEEIAVFGCRDELLGAALVVLVIGLAMPGQRDHARMVEIVVPQGVETVTAGLERARQLRMLRLVFADHHDV